MSKYSQFNEEQMLEEIFAKIGTKNKYFVEIGCHGNGFLSNTYLLKEKGWIGHWFDITENPGVIVERFTKDNINDLLRKYDVPYCFDLLSIDIDGNDYWLLKELTYKPRVIVIEFNPHKQTGIQEYDENYTWDNRNRNFGTSRADIEALAKRKGYHVYGANETNLFLCQSQ